MLLQRLAVVGWLTLAVGVTAGGCAEEAPEPNLGALGDASYGDAPERTVIDGLPDGFFEPLPTSDLGPGGPGSTPIGPGDGGVDRPSVPGPDGAPNGGNSDAAGSCNLLLQDCAGDRGCYPSGAAGVCRQAGVVGENQTCFTHEECAPGLLCVDPFGAGALQCAPICNPRSARPCPANRPCEAFPGSTIGVCGV